MRPLPALPGDSATPSAWMAYHARTARLLAEDATDGDHADGWPPVLLARAQVHATLAAAYATFRRGPQ